MTAPSRQAPRAVVDADRDPAWLGLIRAAGAGGIVLLGWALRELWRVADGSGSIAGRFSSAWATTLALAVGLSLIGGGLALWAGLRPAGVARLVRRLNDRVRRVPVWGLAIISGALLALALIVLRGIDVETLQLEPIRLLVACAFSLPLALALPGTAGPGRRLALALLSIASLVVVIDRLSRVTDFPFALGWSEGNRLWDYSLYFGRRAFTVAGDFRYPTYLAPGRHGLWGLAFLIPGISIAAVRLWDAVLWTAPYFILGFVLLRRERKHRLIFGLWTMLFIHQGPVYSPLVVSAILLAAGYDRRRPWRTAAVTALACFYAGVSRWTWLVAPALWASMWSLIESPDGVGWRHRLRRPFWIGLAGAVGAVASQAMMAAVFPQPEAPFATTARQALLWYRLLPSATNPDGILPALVLALTPLLLLIGVAVARRWWAWDRWSLAGVVAVVVATGGVGLAASVKIGGGNNLHNLDMLLVSLVILAAIGLRTLEGRAGRALTRLGPIVALVVLVPAARAIPARETLSLPPASRTAVALADLQASARQGARRGEVLFIDQRQLFAFGELPGVPLVLDYELKDLMNQAMGGNQAYLERFRGDLAAQRFSLIVVDPLPTSYQGRERAFGEENDAWVTHVALPILEHYGPLACLDEAGVCLYVPLP